jgi:hypothetical protein
MRFLLSLDTRLMTLMFLENVPLRTAIRRNLVTFPGQVRSFMKCSTGGLQERVVQLYFVRGWSTRNIAARYGLSRTTVFQLLRDWRIRAIEAGYIQEIEPDCLASLVPRFISADEARNSSPEPVLIEHGDAISRPVPLIYADSVLTSAAFSNAAVLTAGRNMPDTYDARGPHCIE